MGTRGYIKGVAGEFLLVTVVTVALAFTFLQGFKIGDTLLGSPLTYVVLVLEVVALFAVASSRRTLLPGCLALLMALVVCCVVGLGATEGAVTQDSAGNWLLGVLLMALCGVAPFALSRGRAGTALLFIGGVFMGSWTQFFFEAPVLAPSLVFLLACIALLVYKNYLCSVRAAMSARKVSFPVGLATGVATAVLAVAVGALAWFAVIAPLSPGVVDVKLITEYRALEEVQARGVSQERMLSNLDLTGSETTTGTRTTDDLRVEEDGIPMPARPLETQHTEEDASGSFTGLDLEELQEDFNVRANPLPPALLGLLALLPLLAVVGYFVGRRRWRTRRLERIRALPPTQQVRALYLFLTPRLARVGFGIPNGQTPLEFAQGNVSAFSVLDAAAGASFLEATRAYVRVAYGKHEATQEEADCLVAYYQGFWKAARRQLGNLRYFFMSFRL